MEVKRFLSKNIVAVVMIPVIGGAHYGWYKLQEIDVLVPAEDRNKLSIRKVLKSFSLTSSKE